MRSEAELGEAPRWDAERRRLLWVDVEGGVLHRFHPASGRDVALALGARVGVATPVAGGGILLALADRLAVLEEEDETVRTLAAIPHDAGRRLNDGACDPAGRFWVGSMALDQRPGGGALYRYAADTGLERVLDEVTLSNGIGWAPGGQLVYYVDSPTRRVDVFDYDVERGTLADRRPFVAIGAEEGMPDGLTVDDEGGVWVALYGGGAVRRYGPDGTLERVLEVPAANVTACCFGGGDGRSLYVTTARQELSAGALRRRPLAGSVFVAEVDVGGPPARPLSA